MNGVDNLIKKIISDTDNYENEIYAKTELEKTEIIENAIKQAEAKAGEIISNAKKDADEQLNRARSIAALEARKQLLAAKREIINEVFTKAKAAFANIPEEKYVMFLGNVAAAVTSGGELSFAAADKKIAPLVMKFLQNRGYNNFTLSDKYAAEIEKGFIIYNGAIKINYSIKAILENMSVNLEPDIVKMLFPDK